ncbi:hypothetical protein F5Y16DRAFT_243491 [Xylariaceae sp. FL0255]|nr:hypothetical protein F5Y16DRAFT_243491 [Xylariaceae sp. FL0255]
MRPPFLLAVGFWGSLTNPMPRSVSALREKRSITCLDVGATATASWTDAEGRSCTFQGVVGSNYGTNAAGGDDANCGTDYVAAEDDFLLGLVDGCSQTNPSETAVAPTTTPTCV